MDAETNAKSQTRTARGEEISGCEGADDATGEKRTGELGLNNGDFSGRAARAIGTGANSNFFPVLVGGILSQLISDAQDQLGKTRECIAWYEREEKEQKERLDNLLKLQTLAEEETTEE